MEWYEQYKRQPRTKEHLELVNSMTQEEFIKGPEHILLSFTGTDWAYLTAPKVCEIWLYYKEFNEWPSMQEAKLLISARQYEE